MPRKSIKPANNSTPTTEAAAASPERVKKELRTIFRDAFDELGGAKWLVKFVNEDPQNARTFVQAVSRLIPLEITGKDGGDLVVYVKNADGTQSQVDMHPPPIEGEAARVLN